MSNGISKVYMICTAYEQGFGKGQDQVNVTNPYKKGEEGTVDGDCYEAWDIGYKAGKEAESSDVPNGTCI